MPVVLAATFARSRRRVVGLGHCRPFHLHIACPILPTACRRILDVLVALLAGQLPKTGSEMRSFSDAVGVGDGEIVFRESGTLRSSERVFVTERDGAPHRRMLIYDEGLMQLAEGLAREFTGDEF